MSICHKSVYSVLCAACNTLLGTDATRGMRSQNLLLEHFSPDVTTARLETS